MPVKKIEVSRLKIEYIPICLTMWLTFLDFPRLYTCKLLSQCPQVINSFASWDTTNNFGSTLIPGANGTVNFLLHLQKKTKQKIITFIRRV